MLGRLRRTTRLDVGLALAFTGISFLAWSFVAGMSREMMRHLIHDAAAGGMVLPQLTKVVKVFFVDTGFVIDLFGLGWMIASLTLIFFASRQKISISWAWMATMGQTLITAFGSLLVGVVCYLPYRGLIASVPPSGALENISQISLPAVVAVAILVWLIFVIGMLIDRARLNRHGPTLTDGLRTNR